MKIAFATTDGKNINEHFGRSGQFAIYELFESFYDFVEVRKFADCRDLKVELSRDNPEQHEDAVEQKVKKLIDCKIVYVTEIGGPASARLVRNGIMPIRVKEGTNIEETLEKLIATIKTSPPPWMKKLIKNKTKKED